MLHIINSIMKIYINITENWNIRDDNLKKQSHLLKKSELKKRGITRYDAELLISQGLRLPEPKELGTKSHQSLRSHSTCDGECLEFYFYDINYFKD